MKFCCFILILVLLSCSKSKESTELHDFSDSSPNQNIAMTTPAQHVAPQKTENDSPDVEEKIPSSECTYYRDYDGDGFGDSKEKQVLPCTAPTPKGFVDKTGDCNDKRPYEHPGMKETCNNVDDNCDGIVDEENADGCRSYYFDEDADGFGINSNAKCLCGSEGKYRAMEPNDCEDSNEKINPEAKEICNTIDDNCNSQTDEGENVKGCTPFYFDGDGDGFGVAQNSKCLCLPFGSYRAKSGSDCNDNNPAVYPGAPEIHDGIDNNCNGRVDEASVIIKKDATAAE